ncbi:class I adenylate-forming enzyme family protein [Hydrogenophaga sp. 5NK40-0174]
MPTITIDSPFDTIAACVGAHAREQPEAVALRDHQASLTWRELDALMDRVAAALQRDGATKGDAIAICAANSVRYAALYLGALRAGVVVAPIAPSVTREQLAQMREDAEARAFFVDASAADLLSPTEAGACVWLDDAEDGLNFSQWLAPEGRSPTPVDVDPADPFNIIYSSGTTGVPKGIVQSHGMRWLHVCRGAVYGYSEQSQTLLSTPLYSNTTLVVFFPTIAFGGCVHLMPRFNALRYLEIASSEHITHTMLVPVQYQRIMAVEDFDRFDLSHFQMKFCTSAPFNAALKSDVLKRWPGGLVEFYGMTEGGGTCILNAHEHPEKLHTVGPPASNHDIRLIDEEGVEVAPGEIGEVVGHSGGMMTGYHKQPEKTREAEWHAPDGKRFIRTGDVGRFDEDGFLVLMDRRKDMIISGGFNIYPSDLEALLRGHPDVQEAAVVGVPSEQWGESPLAFVVLKPGHNISAAALTEWHNQRCAKTQRLIDTALVAELPRSAIGKVLKRELREQYMNSV